MSLFEQNSFLNEISTKLLDCSNSHNFRFNIIKKENVNKKVVRTFSNFILQAIKSNNKKVTDLIYSVENHFWINFSSSNSYQPPCTFETNICLSEISFKSYNDSYMKFLFNKENCSELYKLMIKDQSYYIENSFCNLIYNKAHKVLLNKQEIEVLVKKEKETLKNYLEKIAYIYKESSFSKLLTKSVKSNCEQTKNKCLDIKRSKLNKDLKLKEIDSNNKSTALLNKRDYLIYHKSKSISHDDSTKDTSLSKNDYLYEKNILIKRDNSKCITCNSKCKFNECFNENFIEDNFEVYAIEENNNLNNDLM